MREFKEIFEAVNSVSGAIKKVKAIIKKSVTNLYPEAFSVEKKNTDAGMGGYNYIQVSFNGKPRPKDVPEIEAVKKGLEKDFQVKYFEKSHVMALYPKDMKVD